MHAIIEFPNKWWIAFYMSCCVFDHDALICFVICFATLTNPDAATVCFCVELYALLDPTTTNH